MLFSFESFLVHCRALRGEILYTGAMSKPFTVEVQGEVIFFVPSSSGKRRRANVAKTEGVLKLLAESKDWSPGAYQQITYHASYILAVAKHAT